MNQYKDLSDLHIDQCTWSSIVSTWSGIVSKRSGMGAFWLWEGVHLQNTKNTHIITHWLGFIDYFYSTTLQVTKDIGVHMVLHCTKKGNFMNKYMSKNPHWHFGQKHTLHCFLPSYGSKTGLSRWFVWVYYGQINVAVSPHTKTGLLCQDFDKLHWE